MESFGPLSSIKNFLFLGSRKIESANLEPPFLFWNSGFLYREWSGIKFVLAAPIIVATKKVITIIIPKLCSRQIVVSSMVLEYPRGAL